MNYFVFWPILISVCIIASFFIGGAVGMWFERKRNTTVTVTYGNFEKEDPHA